MTPITSPHNHQLKDLRRLQRRRDRDRSGLFVAEGEDLIAAALAAGRAAVAGYRVAGAGPQEFTEVEGDALAAVCSLGSGVRVLAVYEQRLSSPAGPLCVYLHGVRDPGNVGTVLRSALAFGASCVALGPGCADPFSPKAVRASMGAVFAVPVARVGGPTELPGERVALVAHAGEAIEHVVRRGALSLLIGGERAGLPSDVLSTCAYTAHIPIAGDSLNAAMAATVALYEVTRSPDGAASRVALK